MSFEFESKAGTFKFRNIAWPVVLEIAECYGWKASGTNPPKGLQPSRWEGGYCTSDGQLVTTQDAKALANAIDDALKDGFRRVEFTAVPTPPVPAQEREQALEKLGAIASQMTIEIVKPQDKRSPKPNRKKKPETSNGPRSLEELAATQGLTLNDLAGLVSVISRPAVAAESSKPWFTTQEGQERLLDFVAFCRNGSFRIQ
jgi:hypothetical protein